MALIKRTVVGANADEKSAILYQDSPNEQDIPNVARSAYFTTANTALPIGACVRQNAAGVARVGHGHL